MERAVLSVLIAKRSQDALGFQEVLTRHGCLIKTRLGIHEIEDCSEDGLVILYVSGVSEDINTFVNDINALESIRARITRLDF